MSVILQIWTILFSILFGLFFYFLSCIHFKYISSNSTIFRIFITFLFVLDSVLLYVTVLYHLNNGIFHFYFLMSVLIGYYIGKTLHKNVKLTKSYFSSLLKKKEKWYNLFDEIWWDLWRRKDLKEQKKDFLFWWFF